MVASVAKSSLGPFFSNKDTGPLASAQVMVKGWPSTTVHSVLVRMTLARAWEKAAARARRLDVVNCILFGDGVMLAGLFVSNDIGAW